MQLSTYILFWTSISITILSHCFSALFYAIYGFSKSFPVFLPLDGIYIQTWSWLQNYLCGDYTYKQNWLFQI